MTRIQKKDRNLVTVLKGTKEQKRKGGPRKKDKAEKSMTGSCIQPLTNWGA